MCPGVYAKDPLPPFPTGFRGASVPCQQMALLVEAILREHIMCNIFSNPVSQKKFDKSLAFGDSKAATTWKFGQSAHTIKRNKMLLNNIFSASTTNAIYWQGTLAPPNPVGKGG